MSTAESAKQLVGNVVVTNPTLKEKEKVVVHTSVQYVARHLGDSSTEQDTSGRTQVRNPISALSQDAQRDSRGRMS